MELAEILLKVSNCLASVRSSQSTSAGTTSTLVDSNMIALDDQFKNGIIFFLSGVLAGKTAVITGWNYATKTFTFAAQSAAPGSGIRYAVSDPRWPRETQVNAVNQALGSMGTLTTKNETLTTIADQVEYTLPIGVRMIKRVQFANNLVEPYDFGKPHRWWIERNGTLYFYDNIPAYTGYKIRLWHDIEHAQVYLDTDEIDVMIDPTYLSWKAAWYAAIQRTAISGNNETDTENIATITNQVAQLEAGIQNTRMPRDSRFGSGGSYAS